jgi:hypothetical protein
MVVAIEGDGDCAGCDFGVVAGFGMTLGCYSALVSLNSRGAHAREDADETHTP